MELITLFVNCLLILGAGFTGIVLYFCACFIINKIRRPQQLQAEQPFSNPPVAIHYEISHSEQKQRETECSSAMQQQAVPKKIPFVVINAATVKPGTKKGSPGNQYQFPSNTNWKQHSHVKP